MLSIRMIGWHVVPLVTPLQMKSVRPVKFLASRGALAAVPSFLYLKLAMGMVTVTHLPPVSYEPVLLHGVHRARG